MSERYGPCPVCQGRGKVTIRRPKDVLLETGEIQQAWEVFERECGRCEGTGFNGDAMDFLDWRRSQD